MPTFWQVVVLLLLSAALFALIVWDLNQSKPKR